ncbi:MAG: phosphoenolpyruvate synthase regulatory protein [Gammaproteobacteria bacterium]|nr:MAG: phosphoenolpyruvate synthase regulatory protein [Gammaproteobacteria bacterium]
MNNERRHVALIVSDRTGLTAEAMAHSLLSQFPTFDFRTETYTFIDSREKLQRIVERCRQINETQGIKPMVFTTIVNDELRQTLAATDVILFDLFDTFIGPMEKTLGMESSHSIGKSHGVNDEGEYVSRMAAVHFSLQTDDGLETDHYPKADLIIVGVSRCGKTPTSLYLALHYGIFVSNYPLTLEDLDRRTLPPALEPHRDKLYGLTIDPFRLLQIRRERYHGSSYSDASVCQKEVAQAEHIYRSAGMPVFNTTRMSVEEIGAKILNHVRNEQTDGWQERLGRKTET